MPLRKPVVLTLREQTFGAGVIMAPSGCADAQLQAQRPANVPAQALTLRPLLSLLGLTASLPGDVELP